MCVLLEPVDGIEDEKGEQDDLAYHPQVVPDTFLESRKDR